MNRLFQKSPRQKTGLTGPDGAIALLKPIVRWK